MYKISFENGIQPVVANSLEIAVALCRLSPCASMVEVIETGESATRDEFLWYADI